MKIIIVDDDKDLIEGLRWYLEAEGCEVLAEFDGEAAIEAVRREHPDLIILDIMMPKMDGIKACEIIRAESDTMIIMLSARDNEIDKVRALKLGADDYVTKPFHISELVARIEALMRRHKRSESNSPNYRWKNLEVSIDQRRVSVSGSDIELTRMEFDLLVEFISSPKVVLSKKQLVEMIWGENFYGELRLVDNLLYRLRKKLADAGCADFPIVTIRGVGYAYRP